MVVYLFLERCLVTVVPTPETYIHTEKAAAADALASAIQAVGALLLLLLNRFHVLYSNVMLDSRGTLCGTHEH